MSGSEELTPGLPDVDPAALREVAGVFPTGVVVVTARTSDGPVGMTMQSFVSLSLDPPLVQVCVTSTSRTWALIEAVGTFSVSILSRHQAQVALQFAGADERFRDVDTTTSPLGHPRLGGACGWLDCRIQVTIPAGDHAIVVAEIVDLAAADPATAADPLVFHQSQFAGLSPLTG